MARRLNVRLIGSGMYSREIILPSLYQLQRERLVDEIGVSSRDIKNVIRLSNDKAIKEAFPNQIVVPFESTQKALDTLKPNQLVIVATPDHTHYEVIISALKANQNVFCVKPLVLKYSEALEIRKIARQKRLWVGIDYHKRFDRRSVLAKKYYEDGRFGKFVIGEANLIEPYYYRNSNFQNWFTIENSDPFTYVGCHYTDLVSFITGLKPKEVSVKGVKSKLPNGKKSFLWAHARIIYENNAVLSIINGLGYPNDAPGPNMQGLTMFFENLKGGSMIKHEDQHRGVSYSFSPKLKTDKIFQSVNPDFFQLVPWEGGGCKPTGYGFDSFSNAVRTILSKGKASSVAATIENSIDNVLISEAGRLSIIKNGLPVRILNGTVIY